MRTDTLKNEIISILDDITIRIALGRTIYLMDMARRRDEILQAVDNASIDNQINDLRRLAESKGFALYNILYRNAGVGIQWFDENLAGEYPTKDAGTPDDVIKISKWTKSGLVIHQYYPTLQDAIMQETKWMESFK